jgi:hypothetical protein
VEGIVPRPEETSDCGNGSRAVGDNAPAEFGKVFSDFIKELVVIDCFISLDQAQLVWLLNYSEVLPVGQVECLLNGEAFECLVDEHLVDRSVLVASLGNDLAVTLNGSHNVAQSVEFCDVLARNNDASIFIHDHRGCHVGDEDSIELSRQECVHRVEPLSKLLAGLW